MSKIIKSPLKKPAPYIIKNVGVTPKEVSIKNAPVESEIKKSTELVYEAKIQSEQILQDALTEKQAIEDSIRHLKEEWELEKEKLSNEARQIGYQEGFGEGKRVAEQEYSSIIHEIKRTLKQTEEQKAKVFDDSQHQLLEAGIRIANKIMNQTLEENPASFNHIAKRVIREVQEENDIKLYVHPSFFDEVYKQKDELKSLLHQEVILTLYPDESLEETQCIVESSFGRIEGGIDKQLQQIKQALTKCLEEG